MKCIRSTIFSITLSVIALCGVYNPNHLSAEPTSPLSDVRATVDEVVRISVSLPGDPHKAERRKKLREVIEPRFDFREMAQRSLGAQWMNCTTEQQEKFTDVFSKLLAKTYLERIETVEENMVKIDSENVSFPKAVVKTTIQRKGDKFPLDYKLLYKNDTWRVYDVVIENIGLVSNYRNEFAGIIRKDGIDGLISRLDEKTREG